MQNIIAAVILAIALVAAAILNGGIYTMRVIQSSPSENVYRLNRLTGSLDWCFAVNGVNDCYHFEENSKRSLPSK